MRPPVGHPARKPSAIPKEKVSRTKNILSLIKDFFIILFLLSVIGFLSWMGYQRLTKNAFFPLKRVILERPVVYADPETITQAVRRYGRADLTQINLKELAAEIRKIDWVKSASVSRQWPDAIKINVQERLPILRWGKDRFLDTGANHFHLPDSPALSQLFPVTGPEGTEEIVLNMYSRINPWLRDHGLNMTALTLDPRLVWHVQLDGKIDVIVGREDLNQRFKKLVVINQKIIKKYEKYIDSVDLRYQGGFSIRWKKGVTSTSEAAEKTAGSTNKTKK